MPNDPTEPEVRTVNEIFSDYVLRLSTGGEPPDAASYLAVCEELRVLLVRELHRRGLWRAPPSHVGLTGSDWSQGALDDLVSEAYAFIFLRRLEGLKNQQRTKPDIRPLVVLNVGHLLTELQRKADPLGYRVFGRLREAVERVQERGKLHVLRGPEKKDGRSPEKPGRIRNETVLSFRPGLAPLTSDRDLEEPVRRWTDDLLPDLVTAEGRAVPKVVRKLADKVVTLKDQGVAAFRFGDLITQLKNDVRRRWENIWQGTQGNLALEDDNGTVQLVRVVPPDEEPDWPDRLVLIQDCVAMGIDAAGPPKNRRDLWSLWTLLRTSRLLPGVYGRLPAFAELGRQLKLGPGRVRQLFDRLWPIVKNCLESAGRRGALPRRAPSHATDQPSDDPEHAVADERRRRGRR